MHTDVPFMGMLAFKAVRALCTYFALELGVRVHSSYYVEYVYGRNEPPPGLWMLVLTVSATFALASALTVAGLVLYGVEGEPLARVALSETLAYTVFVCAVVAAVGWVVGDHKYFGYYSDGLRALRAFKWLALAFCLPVCLLPVPLALPRF